MVRTEEESSAINIRPGIGINESGIAFVSSMLRNREMFDILQGAFYLKIPYSLYKPPNRSSTLT